MFNSSGEQRTVLCFVESSVVTSSWHSYIPDLLWRELKMFTNEFMRNLSVYISVYLFGLWGLGLTSITVCIILTIILIHVDTILKKNEKTKTTSPPWWIEASSVSRCEWLNEILSHTWPHFQSYLQHSFPIMLDEIGKILIDSFHQFELWILFRGFK